MQPLSHINTTILAKIFFVKSEMRNTRGIVIMIERVSHRERDRDRQTDTEREIQREIERKQRQRQLGMSTEKERGDGRERDRQTVRQTDSRTDTDTGREAETGAERKTERATETASEVEKIHWHCFFKSGLVPRSAFSSLFHALKIPYEMRCRQGLLSRCLHARGV